MTKFFNGFCVLKIKRLWKMKILHTADLHLGQIMYHYYDRVDEHDHYFEQLRGWCAEYRPDALVVSGDIYDIAQPGAAVKEYFNRQFVDIHSRFPEMNIVVTAGNHDSASRIEADGPVWGLSGVTLVGHGPSTDVLEGGGDTWQDRFIVELPTGFIVAIPFMVTSRRAEVQSILDRVARRNQRGLPVVMTAHTAVAGGDFTGHGEIGTIKTTRAEEMGEGFDYLALGHIHRPQTIGRPLEEEREEESRYASPVMRYSGSALHVSCDEQYPHSVSLVEIERHGGEVTVRRLRIDELRHFYIVPPLNEKPATTGDEVAVLLREFVQKHERGYIRLNLDYRAEHINLQKVVYPLLEATGNEVRFNPNTIWQNRPSTEEGGEAPKFEMAELQQMTNPLEFVMRTIERYPAIDPTTLEKDFAEIEKELIANEN